MSTATVAWAPTEETVDVYTNGDCWFLALELHRLTGFPMIFSASTWLIDDITGPEGYTEDWADSVFAWDHVGIELPDGRILDVNGPEDIEDWMCLWSTGDSISTADPDRIATLLKDDAGGSLKRLYPKHNARALARRMLNAFDIAFTGRRHRDALTGRN